MTSSENNRFLLRLLLRMFRPYPWALPVLIVLGIGASLAEAIGIGLFLPLIQSLQGGTAASGDLWPMQHIAEFFNGFPQDERMWVLAALILGMTCTRTLLNYVHSVLFRWVDSRIVHRIRSEIFQQLQTVSFRFVETTEIGRLTNILTGETWRVSDALATFVHAIVAVFTLVVYIALLFALSWKLVLICAAAMLFSSALVRVLTLRLQWLGRDFSAANSALHSRMIEGIQGTKVIRLFGREREEQSRFDEVSQKVSDVIFRMYRLGDAVGPVYDLVASVLLVAVLLGTYFASVSLATVLVFAFVLYRLQPKVMDVSGTITRLFTYRGALNEVDYLLRRDNKSYPPSGNEEFARLDGDIHLANVSFQYRETARPALDRVSLTIPTGHTTALVGPSGSGKSTLAKLLMRLYEPTSGQIEVNGRLLEEYDLRSWRSRIAVVSQEHFLFDRTVAENIAFGSPDARRDEVVAAAKLADAHEFVVGLPDGYETLLGSGGVRLSGGQQQRIALARAIIRDPEVLILDEPTNSLDSISENAIQRALDVFSSSRTVIVIAHRFATIERADYIAVLKDGRIDEHGSLTELLNQNGIFAEMFRLQNRSTAGFRELETVAGESIPRN